MSIKIMVNPFDFTPDIKDEENPAKLAQSAAWQDFL